MPRSRTNPSLLAQIAWLHYHKGLSQTQIADLLDLSKMVVSRSLRRAFDLGIVTVSISQPFTRSPQLEEELARLFPSVRSTVITGIASAADGSLTRSDTTTPGDSAALIGAAFAHYFFTDETCLPSDGGTIGIGLGSTVASFVENLTPMRTPSARVVQLIGGLPMAGSANPFSILHGLAQKLHAAGVHLPTNALLESAEEREAIVNGNGPDPTQTAPGLWPSTDCAIFGIGRIARNEPRTALLNRQLTSSDEASELLSSGAVCELLGHCLDPSGVEVQTGVTARIAAIPSPILRSLPRRIALAGSAIKAPSIAAALRSGIVTELFTDGACAVALAGGGTIG
ncbi:MAG: sugar-binding transcriptional regulator [Spirochaetaceae bacterium]